MHHYRSSQGNLHSRTLSTVEKTTVEGALRQEQSPPHAHCELPRTEGYGRPGHHTLQQHPPCCDTVTQVEHCSHGLTRFTVTLKLIPNPPSHRTLCKPACSPLASVSGLDMSQECHLLPTHVLCMQAYNTSRPWMTTSAGFLTNSCTGAEPAKQDAMGSYREIATMHFCHGLLSPAEQDPHGGRVSKEGGQVQRREPTDVPHVAPCAPAQHDDTLRVVASETDDRQRRAAAQRCSSAGPALLSRVHRDVARTHAMREAWTDDSCGSVMDNMRRVAQWWPSTGEEQLLRRRRSSGTAWEG